MINLWVQIFRALGFATLSFTVTALAFGMLMFFAGFVYALAWLAHATATVITAGAM